MVRNIEGAIGEGTKKKGMKQPLKYWVLQLLFCGLTFYSGRNSRNGRKSFLRAPTRKPLKQVNS